MTTETTKRAALPLTDAQIAELERMEAAASSGPWFVWRGASGGAWLARDADGGAVIGTESTLDVGTVEMIAASRSAMPSLLAEVRASRAARASPEEGRALGRWIRAFGHLHAAVAPHLTVNVDDPEAMAREAVAALRSPPEPREPRRCRCYQSVEIPAGRESTLTPKRDGICTYHSTTGCYELATALPVAPPPEDSGARACTCVRGPSSVVPSPRCPQHGYRAPASSKEGGRHE